MRVNILEAGLVTFMLAGTGHLQQDDDTPKPGADTDSWASVTLPAIKPDPPRKPPR